MSHKQSRLMLLTPSQSLNHKLRCGFATHTTKVDTESDKLMVSASFLERSAVHSGR